MNSPLYNKFKIQIQSLSGFVFQDFVEKLFLFQYGCENFIIIRKHIDHGADGIIVNVTNNFIIACYGPENIPTERDYISKINTDFEKYIDNWQNDNQKWMFVTNHSVPAGVFIKINKLITGCSILGITNLLEIIFDVEIISPEQRRALGRYLNIEECYFNQEYSEKETANQEVVICSHGKLINKDFISSFLSINACKYLVYDRYSDIRIWIGDPNIITELNKIEYRFNEITKGEYGERKWERKNVNELIDNENNENEAKFLVIEEEKDYERLQHYIQPLMLEKSIILCFNYKNISLSKIYAYDLFNKLSKREKTIPILIAENIYDKSDAIDFLPYYTLMKEILKTLKLDIPKNTYSNLSSFCENEQSNTIFFDFIESMDKQDSSENIKSTIYSLLFKFGNKAHRNTLIKRIEMGEDPGLIFKLIKDDLLSIRDFLDVSTDKQLITIVEKERRDLLLLLIAGKHFEVEKNKLNLLLSKFCNEDCEIEKTINGEEEFLVPQNPKELWIIKELHLKKYREFSETADYDNGGAEMNYSRLMMENHRDDSLKWILENESLRIGFKIINPGEYNPQVEEKFKIIENLFIYEI